MKIDTNPTNKNGSSILYSMHNYSNNLNLIVNKLLSAKSSCGSSILIFGEEGIGKSTLLSVIKSDLLQKGAVVSSIGGKICSNTPYGVIQSCIKNFRESIGGISLIPMALSGIDIEPNLSGARFRVLENILQEIKNISGSYHPLILMIDDVDHCDLGTQEFISYLSRVISTLPVSFLGSAESIKKLSNEIAEEIKSENIEAVKIHSYNLNELNEILNKKEIHLTEEQLKEAKGNPLKAIRLGTGDINRLVNMSHIEKELLKITCVYGGRIKTKFLIDIIKCDEESMVNAIEHLISSDIIQEDTEDYISFSHQNDLTEVDKWIGNLDRRKYATKIIDVIKRIGGNNKERYADTLSLMCELTYSYSEAYLYGKMHMDYLIKGYAIEDAIRVGERIKEIYDRRYLENDRTCREQSTDMNITLGDLYYGKGEVEKAYLFLKEALKIAIRWKIYDKITDIHIKLGTYHFEKGEYDLALSEYKIALSIVKDKNIKYESLIYNYIGHIYEMKGANSRAMEYYKKAEVIARKNNIENEFAHALHRIGTLLYTTKELDQAEEYLKKSAIIRGKLGLLREQGYTFNNLGVLKHENWKIEEAMNYYKKAKDIAERIFDLGGVISSNSNIAVIYAEFGEFEKAEKMLAENILLSKKIKSPYNLVLAYFNISNIYLEKNGLEKAIQYIKYGEKVAKEHNISFIMSEIYNLEAEIEIRSNNLVEGKAYINKGYELNTRYGQSSKSVALIKATESLYYIYTNNYVKAEALIKEAIALSISIHSPEIARLYDQYGDILVKMGKPDKAETFYIKSKEIYDRVGNQYYSEKENQKIKNL